MSLEPADAIVERLDCLHVWPQSIACHYADTLTPRQISELYQIGAVATAAKARIAALVAEVARKDEALRGMREAIRKARNMVADDDESVAAEMFAHHLNKADDDARAALEARND